MIGIGPSLRTGWPIVTSSTIREAHVHVNTDSCTVSVAWLSFWKYSEQELTVQVIVT